MIRLAFITLALLISTACRCQVHPDSLAGTYAFGRETGGGFTGGPNGSCMTRPPDYKITTRLTILPDLTVARMTDTVGYRSLHIHWGCDTLYLGKAKIVADTLIVTYTRKPVCPYYQLVATKQKQEPKRYKTLEAPITEKFLIEQEGRHIQGLRKWDDTREWYEKERLDDTKH
jgi:hypothetical protein